MVMKLQQILIQMQMSIGLFNYPVPTNCLAITPRICLYPTICPNSATQSDDHFNTVLYTGNDADDIAITGVGFHQIGYG